MFENVWLRLRSLFSKPIEMNQSQDVTEFQIRYVKVVVRFRVCVQTQKIYF